MLETLPAGTKRRASHHFLLKATGVKRGSARRSSLKGREVIVNQTNTGTVSKATLEKRLRDWAERIYYGLFRVYKYYLELNNQLIVQELCESRGGRPGLPVLTSRLVSVDVKLY